MYVIIEGPDGTGKDTQADLLVDRLYARHGCKGVLRVNEPDSTLPTGQLLRRMLKEGDFIEAHAAMFLADRMAMLSTKAKPAIDKGEDVVSVRSFLSTLVYQQENWPVEWLMELHRFLPAKADHLIILNIDPEVALQRSRKRPGPDEFYEKLDIQQRVQARYLELASQLRPFIDMDGAVHVIDANGSIGEVHDRIMQSLRDEGETL